MRLAPHHRHFLIKAARLLDDEAEILLTSCTLPDRVWPADATEERKIYDELASTADGLRLLPRRSNTTKPFHAARLLARAADLLNESAEVLRSSCTLPDRVWPPESINERRLFQELTQTRAWLRVIQKRITTPASTSR